MIKLTRWPPPGSRDQDSRGPILTPEQVARRQENLKLWEIKLYGRRVGWVGTEDEQVICWLPDMELTAAEKRKIEEHVRDQRRKSVAT